MELNVQHEICRALNKKIQIRIGENDPTITYQEFVLYWILRACASNEKINIDEKYTISKNNGWIDEQWLACEASKYHEMETPLEWDKVFDW